MNQSQNTNKPTWPYVVAAIFVLMQIITWSGAGVPAAMIIVNLIFLSLVFLGSAIFIRCVYKGTISAGAAIAICILHYFTNLLIHALYDGIPVSVIPVPSDSIKWRNSLFQPTHWKLGASLLFAWPFMFLSYKILTLSRIAVQEPKPDVQEGQSPRETNIDNSSSSLKNNNKL